MGGGDMVVHIVFHQVETKAGSVDCSSFLPSLTSTVPITVPARPPRRVPISLFLRVDNDHQLRLWGGVFDSGWLAWGQSGAKEGI